MAWSLPPAAAALFDSVLNATDDGVVIVDRNGRVSYVNEPFRRMWGLETALLEAGDRFAVQAAILDQVVDGARFQATLGQLVADPAMSFESLIERKDGRFVEARTQPQKLDGEVAGRVWWFRDVTDRRQIELNLRQSEERFAHLFLASPFSILLATYPEGRIVDVNPAFTKLFQRERADVVGKTTSEIRLWADSADRERMIGQLRAGLPVEGMEFAFTTPSGELRVVYLSIELVQLQGQWHSLASSVDVTAAKRVEAALRESELRYRTLFDAIADTVYLVSAEGRFLAMNQAFETATGWPRSEWLGRPFIELVHPDDRERAIGMFTRAVAGERAITSDLKISRRTGDWIVAECTPVYPLLESGQISGFLGTGRDVTRQRQLEDNVRQAQKMEALGTLAGGIAHDFNNILTAIVGHAEFLQAELGRERGAEDLAGILGATRRAKALVRQILTFSRQQPEERNVIALGPVVREAVALLRATMPATITIDVALEDPDALILADATQVHQVIINLGTNALHAMRKSGGILRLEGRSVALTDADREGLSLALAPGRYLRLGVVDTGHGMSPETLRRVFDPFFTTKPPTEGSGLGLAVVHGIVRGHEGDIVIHSEPGRGTRALVYFPQVFASEQIGSTTAGPPPRGSGQRVLLVDDEPALVALGGRMLTALGYQARGFESAEAALEAFRAAPADYDLVFSDLTMPKMTGAELARSILAERPDLPIVLTSGYPGVLGIDEMRALGIREVITKPFEIRNVAEALARCLGRLGSDDGVRPSSM